MDNEELLLPYKDPYINKYTVCDTMEIYSDESERIEQATSINFRPYAVTSEVDVRPEVLAKAKLSGMVPFRRLMWLKRIRDPEEKCL